MTALAAILFWLSAGLIVYTHLGYPVVLWVLVRARSGRERKRGKLEVTDASRLPPSPSSFRPTTRRR